MKKSTEKYDVICSLGYNCEVSFRIEDFWGNLCSTPFTWSFATDRDKFVKAIQSFEDIFTGDVSIQEDNMFMCEKYGLKFHPRYAIFPHHGAYTKEQEEEALSELKSRVAHLKELFSNLSKSGKRVLFFLKVDDKGDADNARYISAVDDALKLHFSSDSYTLAVIMIKGHVGAQVKELESRNIKAYEVKKFASQRFTDIGGDVSGWLRMFKAACGGNGNSFHFYCSLYKRRIKRYIASGKNFLKKLKR